MYKQTVVVFSRMNRHLDIMFLLCVQGLAMGIQNVFHRNTRNLQRHNKIYTATVHVKTKPASPPPPFLLRFGYQYLCYCEYWIDINFIIYMEFRGIWEFVRRGFPDTGLPQYITHSSDNSSMFFSINLFSILYTFWNENKNILDSMSILMIHAQRARKKTSLFSEKIYTVMIDNVMKISCMNLQHIHIRTRQIILHRNISRVFFFACFYGRNLLCFPSIRIWFRCKIIRRKAEEGNNVKNKSKKLFHSLHLKNVEKKNSLE